VDQIRTQAREAGMTTLLEDGVHKVLLGQTDLKQVLAVCSR
jgi:type II secretory ATPase GspE/PulE/Tfp pilus assembly ATPase PilB-like protein